MFSRLLNGWMGLLAAFAVAEGVQAADGSETLPPRPNILFLLTDDQSIDSIRALGNLDVDTPNLDRLAARGLTFTHAYNMGSWHAAVCMPSRAMLQTGRFLWDQRRVDDAMEDERREGRLWSEILKAAGYRTYLTGKWHVRLDAASTFEETGTVRPGMPDVVPNRHPHAYDRPREGVPDPWDPANPAEGGFWSGGRHWSEVLADETVAFLEGVGGDDRPFFVYAAFNAPHDPRQAPPSYLDRYPPDRIALPANFLPEYPFRDAIGSPHSLRDEFLAPMPRTAHAVAVHRREYFALVTHLDTQIGRILDALERSGRAASTWIILTSDHGLAVGRHGLMGKQNLYEHSVRVPFIVAGPGVPAGRRTDEPIYYQDVMPTTLELAGVAIPGHVSYQSLVPIVRGDGRSKYRSIYTAYTDRQRAVSMDGWKLMVYPTLQRARLYHLTEDPDERRDLAGDARHIGRVRELFRELRQWQVRTGDETDLGFVPPGE